MGLRVMTVIMQYSSPVLTSYLCTYMYYESAVCNTRTRQQWAKNGVARIRACFLLGLKKFEMSRLNDIYIFCQMKPI